MTASPSASSSRRSPASSLASLLRSGDQQQQQQQQQHHQHHRHGPESPSPPPPPPHMPIDTLVNHLLVSKRSLSSMTLVVRANELATAARTAHDEAVVLDAQVGFLRGAVADQMAVLVRVRRSLHATYEWGTRDFGQLVRAMDEADGELAATMDMLGHTLVHAELRPAGEDRRSLLDFVDETSVHGMRDAMKKSIEELQAIQQSFDGDLLRFETDMRDLGRAVATDAARRDREALPAPALQLLASMDEHSSTMAQLLASLTKHFDMCVTAVRTTEGAAALARRRAAEATATQPQGDDVSISGVIAENEPRGSDLEPETAQDRAEMLKVVTQDADEVDDVVREIQERLAAIEADYDALRARAHAAAAAYLAMLAACAALGDVGDRLADYLAAEDDFRARWQLEKDVVFARLRDMAAMRDFYEGYASAHASLVLETERRRAVDKQVEAVWRKARDAAERLLDADAAARDAFRLDVGEFLPTDLWSAVEAPARRWAVVPLGPDDEPAAPAAPLAARQSPPPPSPPSPPPPPPA